MQMMYENTQDAPGNYVTCHFVGYPHKHTGCIPKCPLEVRPRLFFCLFLTSNSVGFCGGGFFWCGLVWFGFFNPCVFFLETTVFISRKQTLYCHIQRL